MKKFFLILSVLAIVSSSKGLRAQEDLLKDLPTYVPVSGISGTLNSIGSDTLNNMMSLWAESFRKMYPSVRISVEGKGSTTAPPALIEGIAQVGPMSRPMKPEEINSFEAKFGFKPTEVGVSLDSLAVYVNKDNPIEALSLEEIDGIFSKNRRGGYASDITTWGQVGVKGELEKESLSIYGRNSASGTYGYFKETALFKGDFKDSVKEQPGSASVVLAVTEDKAGIGYSGIGYRTSGVKAIKLSKKKGDEAFEATYRNVLERKYPLGRMLYIYVIKKPNEPMANLEKEFMKFILSKEGQEIVIKDGYLPLTKELIERYRKILD